MKDRLFSAKAGLPWGGIISVEPNNWGAGKNRFVQQPIDIRTPCPNAHYSMQSLKSTCNSALKNGHEYIVILLCNCSAASWNSYLKDRMAIIHSLDDGFKAKHCNTTV